MSCVSRLRAQTAQTRWEEPRDNVGDLCNSAQEGQAVAVGWNDVGSLQHNLGNS